MEANPINQVDTLNDNYETVVKDSSNILNEINFETEDDALIMKSIINSLEKEIVENFKDGKTVSIPYIGCIRKSVFQKRISDRTDEIKENYRTMTPEEYKEYHRKLFKETAIEVQKQNYIKYRFRRIRSINKKKYDELVFVHGIHYADFWIKSIYWLKDVPFDPEVQAAYDRLKD